jgi:hypothetical protein
MNNRKKGRLNPLATILYPGGKPNARQPEAFSWHVCWTCSTGGGVSDDARLVVRETIRNIVLAAKLDERDSTDVLTQIAEHLLRDGGDAKVGLSLIDGIDLTVFKIAVMAGHEHEGDHNHGGVEDPAAQHRADPRLITLVDIGQQIAYVYEPNVVLELCRGCASCE